ncbi:MAG: hypothetical protein ACRCY8_10080 [Dermatophilaceae bacterium]
MPDLGGASAFVRREPARRLPHHPPARRPASVQARWSALAVLVSGGPVAASLAATPGAAAAEPVCRTERFDDSGAGLVEWTVPPGEEGVRATVAGGRGGDAVSGGYPASQPSQWAPSAPTGGGRGAVVTGELDVSAGDTVVVAVGGGADGAVGGAGGGGDAAAGPFSIFEGDGGEIAIRPGGGGGASDVRVGGAALTDRVLVAAGGGGAGAISWAPVEGSGTPIPPDLVGDGGDAGSAGRSSVGWIDFTLGSDPFDGTPVEGQTETARTGAGVGTLTGGAAGGAAAGGAPARPDALVDPLFRYPLLTGTPGSAGRGGDGARGDTGSPSSPSALVATAGGGGGGGWYGGGGGGGMGVRGGSEPVPGLVSGGGGGSSLGEVTGLNDEIDGYVELTACVAVGPSANPGPTSSPTPSATSTPSSSSRPTTPVTSGSSGRGGADAGRAAASEPLADTGPMPLAYAALAGASALGCGLLMHRWASRRRDEEHDRA